MTAGNLVDTRVPALFYVVSGWANGSYQAASDDYPFELRLTVTYYTGSSYVQVAQTAQFNKSLTGWQYVSSNLVFPAKENAMINEIRFEVCYYGHPGIALFDNISVFEGTTTSSAYYAYDEEGRLIAEKVGSGYTRYRYNSSGDMVQAWDHRNNIYNYNYNSKHLPISTVHQTHTYSASVFEVTNPSSQLGTLTVESSTQYSYNASWQCTKVETYDGAIGATGTTYTVSHTAYYPINSTTPVALWGRVQSETDALGRTTRY